MSWMDAVTEVKDIPSFMDYTRSKFGTAVTPQDRIKFSSQWSQFQADNPHVTLDTLVQTVDWAKASHQKITSLCGVMYLVPAAQKAGMLPELTPKDREMADLEEGILKALEVESDPTWRRKLIMSQGSQRHNALNSWRVAHA